MHTFTVTARSTGNLILVKEIMEYSSKSDTKAYMIMVDLKKAYNRINCTVMIATFHFMNISKRIIFLILLLYEDSLVIIVMNDVKGKRFWTRRGV